MSNRGDGPRADRDILADGRQIVPAGHAPRLEAVRIARLDEQTSAFRIRERDSREDAWIETDQPVEVRE